MKRLIFSFSLFLAAVAGWNISAQNIQTPYIEIDENITKDVTPDKITLSISIDEKNYRKTSIAQLEKEMISALKSIDIDVAKKLKVNDMSSSLKYAKARNQDATLYKSYSLELSDVTTASAVLASLQEIGISNISVDKVEYSAIDSLTMALQAEAVVKARNRAETMVKAIGQELGKAIYIVTSSSRSNAVRTKAYAKMALADNMAVETAEPLPALEFKDIQVSVYVNVRFEL